MGSIRNVAYFIKTYFMFYIYELKKYLNILQYHMKFHLRTLGASLPLLVKAI